MKQSDEKISIALLLIIAIEDSSYCTLMGFQFKSSLYSGDEVFIYVYVLVWVVSSFMFWGIKLILFYDKTGWVRYQNMLGDYTWNLILPAEIILSFLVYMIGN